MKSKALPKMNTTTTSSEWFSARSFNDLNEIKSPFKSMIPCEKISINTRQFMLSTAKLSQSYMDN